MILFFPLALFFHMKDFFIPIFLLMSLGLYGWRAFYHAKKTKESIESTRENQCAKSKECYNYNNLLIGLVSIMIYFGFLTLNNQTSHFFPTRSYLSSAFLKSIFLFTGIFSLLNVLKKDFLITKSNNRTWNGHFWYGLLQILSLSWMLLGFFSITAYTIFYLSKGLLTTKDAFDFSKWSIGAIGLGLNAFNIKLFVDYFRGAKVNAPYSLEQLQQLQILQKMQSNLQVSASSEKQLVLKEQVISELDILTEIQKVKDNGNL